jgi:hypothetical protein
MGARACISPPNVSGAGAIYFYSRLLLRGHGTPQRGAYFI